jgi:hypothetical protein
MNLSTGTTVAAECRPAVGHGKIKPAHQPERRGLSRLLVCVATSLSLTLAVAMPATIAFPGNARADDPVLNQDNVGQYGSDRAYWRHKNQQENNARSHRRNHRRDWNGRYRDRGYRDRGRGSDIGAGVAGAILGLGAGAIIGQSLSGPQRAAPPPRYRGRPEPWTRAWYNYCSAKYRSFNPRTGYYTAYSGRKRFCR